MKQCSVRSANWHITSACNYSCRFCFSQNLHESPIHDLHKATQVLTKLYDVGVEKVNYVGGEPLLHPMIRDLAKTAKGIGMVVSITTNGSLLDDKTISGLAPLLDWVGVSIDSADEAIEAELGRGRGRHVAHAMEACGLVHDYGIKLKVNTTVTRLNYGEDMKPLMAALEPHRWKVFQMLHIRGQNDDCIQDLSITGEEFEHFKSINRDARLKNGGRPVFERCEDMVDSYLMISPGGNVMANTGRTMTMRNFDRLVSENLNTIVDIPKYYARGGVYDW